MANKTNPVVLVLLIVAALLLLKQGGFLASIVTTCESVEPKDFTSFVSYYDNQRDLIQQSGAFSIKDTNATLTYINYKVTSKKVGTYNLVALKDKSCSSVLNLLLKESNASSAVINKKSTVGVGSNYYWCNEQNNILLNADSLITQGKYVNDLQRCKSVVGPDYVVDETVCNKSMGTMKGDFCYCQDNLLQVNQTCTKPRAVNKTTATTTTTSGGVSSLTTATTTTPTTTVTTPTTSSKTTIPLIIVGILVALFGYYWFFEKGEKGLFKKI